MPEPKSTLYRTSDIYFAAYLSSVDFDLVTTEEESGGDGRRKLVFVFRVDDIEMGRIKASYFSGNATVKVRRFVDNLKSLKSMVYI
jgi:hypothetical protein